MYEEQELTMQVFSEPEISQIETEGVVMVFKFDFFCYDYAKNTPFTYFPQQPATPLGRRDSYEVSQVGDNTYATILPRNLPQSIINSEANGTIRDHRLRNSSSISTIGNGEIADYATLRNVNGRAPSTVNQLIFIIVVE